jgi:hypothetical protein
MVSILLTNITAVIIPLKITSYFTKQLDIEEITAESVRGSKELSGKREHCLISVNNRFEIILTQKQKGKIELHPKPAVP